MVRQVWRPPQIPSSKQLLCHRNVICSLIQIAIRLYSCNMPTNRGQRITLPTWKYRFVLLYRQPQMFCYCCRKKKKKRQFKKHFYYLECFISIFLFISNLEIYSISLAAKSTVHWIRHWCPKALMQQATLASLSTWNLHCSSTAGCRQWQNCGWVYPGPKDQCEMLLVKPGW